MTEIESFTLSRQTSESEVFGDVLPADWLKQLRDAYPKREGGGSAARAIERLVLSALANGAKWERIILGAKNYGKFCARKGMIGTEYVMMLKTFVGRDWHFEEWADADMRTPAEIAQDAKWEALETRARALGFKEVDRSKGLATVEYALKQEEGKRSLRVVS